MKHLLFLLTFVTCLNAHNATTQQQVQEYLRIAHEHKERNEIDSALRFYQSAIELEPTNYNLIFEVGNFLFLHGFIEQALTYYDRAAELNPHAEQIHFNKGVAYNELNQHEKAAECFLHAINANHLYERAHLHAVTSFRSCQKIDQGIEVAKRSVKVISNNAELHYRYGLLLKDKKLYKKALKQFTKAVSFEPTDKLYLLELGNTLYHLQEYQEALYVFERMLELNPIDTQLLTTIEITLAAIMQKIGSVPATMHDTRSRYLPATVNTRSITLMHLEPASTIEQHIPVKDKVLPELS
jgi:tetratricopeptide (TPR) repeat protein